MTAPYVSPLATIEHDVNIREGVYVSDTVTLEAHVLVEQGTYIAEAASIGYSTEIGEGSVIRSGVIIGPLVHVGKAALILEAARICPDDVGITSSDARKLLDNVTIGPGVYLDNQVELGKDAMVPTQRTIVCLGHFGAKNRVVTIYGSDIGPRFSIGCQIGEDFATIQSRVGAETDSTAASAGTYVPYLRVFQELGSITQRAYNAEHALIQELSAQRLEMSRSIR